MDEDKKVDTLADDHPKLTARKLWHAPRFFVTDVIATNGACTGGGTEAGSPNLAS